MYYKEYPLDYGSSEFIALLNAFSQAADDYEPRLYLDRSNSNCHQLLAAGKVVAKLIFVDGREVQTLERLRPFVEGAQAVGYHLDYLEIVRSGTLWLVDPESLTWVSTREEFIKKSLTQPRQLTPQEEAVARELARAGGQELGPDST